MNLGILLASFFLSFGHVGPMIHEHVTPERIQNNILMEARECVGRSEGSVEWCRERAERKILSALK